MRWRETGCVVALLGLVLAQVACAQQAPEKTTISGQVLGEPQTYDPVNPTATAPIAATMLCNGVSVQTSASGKYTLRVAPAKQYVCTVAAPLYESQTATIPGSFGAVIALNFGVVNQSACSADGAPVDIECSELKLQRGTVSGIVTYAGGHTAAQGALVECAPTSPTAHDSAIPGIPDWSAAIADGTGAYTLKALYPGEYGCVASATNQSAALQHVTVGPDTTATANFQVCQRRCPPVHYHLGPVMHTFTAYLIFWLPRGRTFEPGGGNTSFESLVERYFRDVGGTRFYGLLTQYWDYRGPVQNAVNLGGAYVDTRPYERCGTGGLGCTSVAATRAQPLEDTDIQDEITRVIAANPSWHPGPNIEFFVFTGYGAEACSTPDSSECTFPSSKYPVCGWHSNFSGGVGVQSATSIIYAYIVDPAGDDGSCAGYASTSPNHDFTADAAIDIASHEQFESVTDPMVESNQNRGWYDDAKDNTALGGEIGDKCESDFGFVGGDGGNITLHSHRYILQAEWSNRTNGCAQS